MENKQTNRGKTTSQLLREIVGTEKILEAVGDGITILDKTYKIIFENEVHRKLFGDNVGKHCYRMYQKREGICGGCPVALTFKDGKSHTVTRQFHTDEGIGYVEITASPLRDSSGKIIAGIEVVRNITERKQIEEALKESEARLRAAIENFPFDFFLIDEDGRYAMQNTLCKERWGDVTGKRPEELPVNKDTLELWKDNNRRAFAGEVVKGEVVLKTKDEEGYYYNIISPILYENKIRGILGINIDITERKKAEDALMQRENELRDKTQSLEELNTALKVLLEKRQEDKIKSEEQMMVNIRELVKPYLKKLKIEGLNNSQKTYMDIIESNLEEIVSSFTVRLSSSHLNLTPTEIQVANLIKQGKRSKEIAELIHISPKSVAFHRGNIRKKLGLQNKKTNLRSYLLSIINTSK